MATLIDNSRPGITVTNTATETPVYTVTIPGGTLGTTGFVFAVLLGKKVKNGGGADGAMIMRIYYGGTLVGQVKPEDADADNPGGIPVKMELQLLAAGSASAQTCQAQMFAARNVTNNPAQQSTSYRTATVDSTVNQTLQVTWQQAATTAQSYTAEAGIVAVV